MTGRIVRRKTSRIYFLKSVFLHTAKRRNPLISSSHLPFLKMQTACRYLEKSKEPAKRNIIRNRFLPDGAKKEVFKQVKNTLSYVYLNLLQSHTGMTQKWGILTGIRPTKLLHKKGAERPDKRRGACRSEKRLSDP